MAPGDSPPLSWRIARPNVRGSSEFSLLLLNRSPQVGHTLLHLFAGEAWERSVAPLTAKPYFAAPVVRREGEYEDQEPLPGADSRDRTVRGVCGYRQGDFHGQER